MECQPNYNPRILNLLSCAKKYTAHHLSSMMEAKSLRSLMEVEEGDASEKGSGTLTHSHECTSVPCSGKHD